jgi:glycosyltransferase involved in cell wall biosynthesis
VHGLSRELARAGHEIDLVTMGFRGLPEYEEVDGVRIHRVPSLRRKTYYCTVGEALSYVLGALPTLRRLVKENHYDLNHTHFIFPDGLLAWAIKRSMRLPYVITAHGSDVPGYNPHRLKFAHKLMSPLWGMVTRDAEQIICPSQSIRSLVEAQNEKLQVSVIPYGFDPRKFHPGRQKQNRIVVVTRMLERKGVQYFLKAIEGLSHDQEVHIVGDGPYLPTLKRMAQHVETPVRFWGWLDHRSPEFTDLFESSGIFVLPSESENFPVVLMEAMAAGMAIITTKGTGCEEVVGGVALLVSPKNPTEIREALSRLICKPALREELGRNARRRLENCFSWQAIGRQYAELYENFATVGKAKDRERHLHETR